MGSVSEARMSFSFTQRMKDELTELAKADGRNLSQYIRTILMDHLETVEKVEVRKKSRRRVRK